ncbi:MAG: hypothetical protein ACTHJ0_04640, partial [Flavipsychrobacter sp.]
MGKQSLKNFKLGACAKVLLCIILLSGNLNSYGDVTTYQWASIYNQRGFVIKQPAGTSDFVAAGTVFDATLSPSVGSLHGIQFMHLDASGNILSTKVHYINVGNPNNHDESYRVVDLTEDPDNGGFYITLQVNDKTPGAEQDFIWLYHVDVNGNRTATYDRHIGNDPNHTNFSHKNYYATATTYYNHQFFVCGYAADGTQFPGEPDATHSDKWGMLVRIYSGGIRMTFWDTPPANNLDFDMPLAMHVDPNTHTLLVTGAANAISFTSPITNFYSTTCGILSMSFDP